MYDLKLQLLIISVVIILGSCVEQQQQNITAITDKNSTHKEEVKRISSTREFRRRCDENFAPDPKYQKACCSFTRRYFKAYWANGGHFLTTYLSSLKTWSCTELMTRECENQTYNFNKFTDLVYKQFCDPDDLQSSCQNDVRKLVSKQNTTTASSEWSILVRQIDRSRLDVQDILNPCVGVALFESVGIGQYFEVIQPHISFCDQIWGGMDADTAQRLSISPWKLAPGCHASLIVGMTVILILGLVTVCGNALIMLVFAKRPKLRNSQFYFKLSIAIADFFVGAIIFPSFVANQNSSLIKERPLGRAYNYTTFNYSNVDNATNLRHRDGGGFPTVFNPKTINFLGFITTMSLFVSVYTLMVASVDRFYAIFKPLQYNRIDSVKRAKYLCIILWVVSVIVCTVPLYHPELRYFLVASILVASGGEKSLVLLTVAFLLPLLAVWIFTIMTFVTSLKHAKNRSRLSVHNSSTKKNKSSIEFRLARTLALMVGVFSLCVIPSVIILIMPFVYLQVTFTNTSVLDITAAKHFSSAQYCIVILLMSNSLWNFFIYSGRDKNFLQAAKEELIGILYCISGTNYRNRNRSLHSTTRNTVQTDLRHKSEISSYSTENTLSNGNSKVATISEKKI